MNWKNIAVGAGAVVAADMLEAKLPPGLDLGGLPIRRALSAFAGAYAGHWAASGSQPSLMTAAITGLGALAAAEVVTKVTPFEKQLGPVSLVRTAGAAVGAWAADKYI